MKIMANKKIIGTDSSASYLKGYLGYLTVERGLSANTVEAYSSDVMSFLDFISDKASIKDVTQETITDYLAHITVCGRNKTTQARYISALRSFFRYLKLEKVVENNPVELIDMPQKDRKLPDVLSIDEVVAILNSVDLSLPNGHRNRAMLEMLYGCGLRVSELVNMRLSDVEFDAGFIKVFGKGSKERLVPIGHEAMKRLRFYIEGDRNKVTVAKNCGDVLFFNNRGKKLTREMVFLIVKNQAVIAGVTKKISPHTFRHSFATHMIQKGADIRVVQEMLGHESILTTEIYTHIDREHLRSVVNRYHPLNDIF